MSPKEAYKTTLATVIEPRLADLLARPTPNRIANILLASEVTTMFGNYAASCRAGFLKSANMNMKELEVQEQRASYGSIATDCVECIKSCINNVLTDLLARPALLMKEVYVIPANTPADERLKRVMTAATAMADLSDHLKTAMQTLRVVFQQVLIEVPTLSVEREALAHLGANKTTCTDILHWFIQEAFFFNQLTTEANLALLRKLLTMCHMAAYGKSTTPTNVTVTQLPQCLSLAATLSGKSDIDLQKHFKTEILDVITRNMAIFVAHLTRTKLKGNFSAKLLLDVSDEAMGTLVAILDGPLYDIAGKVVGEWTGGYGAFKTETYKAFREKLILPNLSKIINDKSSGVAAACEAFDGVLLRKLIGALGWKQEALDEIVSEIEGRFKSEVRATFKLSTTDNVQASAPKAPKHVDPTIVSTSPTTFNKATIVADIIALRAKYVTFCNTATSHNIPVRFTLHSRLQAVLVEALRLHRARPEGTTPVASFEVLVAKEIDHLLKARSSGSSAAQQQQSDGMDSIKQVAELVTLFTADPSPFINAYKSFMAQRLLLQPRYSKSGETIALHELASRLGGDAKAAAAVFPLRAMLKEADRRLCNALIWPESQIQVPETTVVLPSIVAEKVAAFKHQHATTVSADSEAFDVPSFVFGTQRNVPTKDQSISVLPDLGLTTCEVEIGYPTTDGGTGTCTVFGPLPNMLALMQLKVGGPTTPDVAAAATGLPVPAVTMILGSLGIIKKSEDGTGYSLDAAALARTRKLVWPSTSVKI